MTEIETRMHLPAHKRTATVIVKGQIDKNIIKDYNHLPGNLDATATMSLYIPPQKTAPFFDAILNAIIRFPKTSTKYKYNLKPRM